MVDTTAPILLLTLPADNATGVSVTSTLRLGFSEAVNATSGLIKIYKSDGTLFHTIAANDTSQVSFDSTKARVTIDPSVTLLAGTSYYVIVESGAFEDLAGNDYAGLSSPTVFNFTTAGTGGGGGSAPADTTAPVLTATSPVDNAAGVAPTTNLVLTFSEAVKAGSGYIDIRESGSGTLVRRIAITDNTQVSISGNQVTVNPVADLSPYTSYYVVLGSGVILDLANNTFAGISNSAVFNFMTNSAYIDTTAPIVLFTSPAFSGNGNIVVTFNEPVVAGTGMIEIRKATDGSVARTISVTDTAQVSFAGRNVTINPATDLDPGVVHYVVIAPGAITDLDGNDYDGYSSVASFVDASAIATGTGIGTTGYGASAVAVGATITNAGFASVALNAFASASAVALGSGVWASVNATATATGTGTGEWSSGDLIGGNDTALNLAVLSYGAALNGELISISNTSVDILGTDGLTYRIFGSGFNFSAGSVAEIGGSGIYGSSKYGPDPVEMRMSCTAITANSEAFPRPRASTSPSNWMETIRLSDRPKTTHSLDLIATT